MSHSFHLLFQNKIFIIQNFTINKQSIMKKSKYQHYLYCFIVCIVVPHEIWFSYQQNIISIVTSAAFRGGQGCLLEGAYQRQVLVSMWTSKDVELIRGWCLFEAWRFLEEIRMRICFKVNCKFTRIRLIYVRYIYNIYLLFLTRNMHSSSSLVLY